jgi:hypothetical protein
VRERERKCEKHRIEIKTWRLLNNGAGMKRQKGETLGEHK